VGQTRDLKGRGVSQTAGTSYNLGPEEVKRAGNPLG
jgi:hypothetical protein